MEMEAQLRRVEQAVMRARGARSWGEADALGRELAAATERLAKAKAITGRRHDERHRACGGRYDRAVRARLSAAAEAETVMVFGLLRQQLEVARDQIAERLAAVEQAEAAMAALAVAFGVDLVRQQRRGGHNGKRARRGASTAPQTASCERCGQGFELSRRGGQRRRFCTQAPVLCWCEACPSYNLNAL
jgi:hypothetical protein